MTKMNAMIMGYHILVDAKPNPLWRVGHKTVCLTPDEYRAVAMMEHETIVKLGREIATYEKKRAA